MTVLATSKLAKFQRQFKKLVQYPTLPKQPALEMIARSKPIDSKTRANVYQESYGYRLLGIMESDFPRTKKLLGKKLFEKTVQDYFHAYPSRYWAVNEIGTSFAEFFRTKKKSFFSDLARYEWAVALSCYAPALADTQNFSDLTKLPPEELLTARLTLDPSVQLVELKWNVHRKMTKKSPKRGAWKVVVYCPIDAFQNQEVTAKQWAVLKALMTNPTLEELLTTLEKTKISSQEAFQWFNLWAKDRIIAGYALS